MSDLLAVSGVVATEPRHLTTNEGLAITSFRLASAQRRYNRQSNTWVDGDTNWYTVTSFRQTAVNVAGSVVKGDRVLLRGKLRIRPWQNSEKSGISVEIEADSIGHDLLWGTSAFQRTLVTAGSLRASEGARPSLENAAADHELEPAAGDEWSIAGPGRELSGAADESSVNAAALPF